MPECQVFYFLTFLSLPYFYAFCGRVYSGITGILCSGITGMVYSEIVSYAEYPAFENGYGRGYALSIGAGAGPDWLMFQRDIRRQSSLCEFTTSIPEQTSEVGKGINVYPNPAGNSMSISLENPKEESHTVSIYTATGQHIQQTQTSTGSPITVETAILPSGLYFFTVQNHDGIIGKGKFVKE